MGLSHRYDLVKGNEDEDIKEEPEYRSVPVVTSWWKLLLCNILAACVGAGVMFLIARGFFDVKATGNAATEVAATSTLSTALTSPTPSVEKLNGNLNGDDNLGDLILDCGGNPSEARAKGCVYDVMMQDWVPEPCYDSVLTERYLAEGNWTWYADGEGKTTMTDEQMRKGEHGDAWMSTSYHKAHCVFSWMKIIRALRNGRGISQELLSYDHVMHCSHGALKEGSTDDFLGVKAPTNYAKCATYEVWKKNPIPDKHDSTQR